MNSDKQIAGPPGGGCTRRRRDAIPSGRRTCESWNSDKLSFFMTEYRNTLVVAKSQQRPELFWLVIGLVLKSSSRLKTWASATRVPREIRASRMLEWLRIERESWSLGDWAMFDRCQVWSSRSNDSNAEIVRLESHAQSSVAAFRSCMCRFLWLALSSCFDVDFAPFAYFKKLIFNLNYFPLSPQILNIYHIILLTKLLSIQKHLQM